MCCGGWQSRNVLNNIDFFFSHLASVSFHSVSNTILSIIYWFYFLSYLWLSISQSKGLPQCLERSSEREDTYKNIPSNSANCLIIPRWVCVLYSYDIIQQLLCVRKIKITLLFSAVHITCQGVTLNDKCTCRKHPSDKAVVPKSDFHYSY